MWENILRINTKCLLNIKWFLWLCEMHSSLPFVEQCILRNTFLKGSAFAKEWSGLKLFTIIEQFFIICSTPGYPTLCTHTAQHYSGCAKGVVPVRHIFWGHPQKCSQSDSKNLIQSYFFKIDWKLWEEITISFLIEFFRLYFHFENHCFSQRYSWKKSHTFPLSFPLSY